MGYSGAWGEKDSCSWHCPFKPCLASTLSYQSAESQVFKVRKVPVCRTPISSLPIQSSSAVVPDSGSSVFLPLDPIFRMQRKKFRIRDKRTESYFRELCYNFCVTNS
jgi:hypothetical protein